MRLLVGIVVAALAGCRLADIVDHESRAYSCANESDRTPCIVNGGDVDRAGVVTNDGVCSARTCVAMRGSEVATMELDRGATRLGIDLAASIASGVIIFSIARRIARRRRTLVIVVVACLPAGVILARYPKRMVFSARTARVPPSTFTANNGCHPAEIASRDGKDFLITNVRGEDSLGELDFLVAYDLASGEPTVLAGPSRAYDHALPALFVRAHDKLGVATTDSVVRIFDIGSFHETARVTLPAPARGIQRAPDDAPVLWASVDKAFGYVDVDRGELAGWNDARAGWAKGLGCWDRSAAFCPTGTPLVAGTHDGRRDAFANGCVQSGLRDDDVVVERRALAAPFAVVWSITHAGEKEDLGRVAVSGDHLYEIERESDKPMLVQRSLADGSKIWSTTIAGRLGLEAPVRVGKWLVVDVFPIEDDHRDRHEIHDATTGALVRTLP